MLFSNTVKNLNNCYCEYCYLDAYFHCVAIVCIYPHLATLLDYVGLSGPFFFCLVCGPLEKEERKNDNWLFFKQLVLTCTIVLVNVLGLDR